MRVVPVDTLYDALNAEEKEMLLADMEVIYQRVTGRNMPERVVKGEYELI